jgi:hypothetical protein
MPSREEISVADHLRKVPSRVRPILEAARRTVKAVAPKAEEIAYQGQSPKSASAMWKIARYSAGGANVVGVGTYPEHSTIFFYRGRELDDGTGLLAGSGKDMRYITLRSPADADRRVVRAMVRKAFKLGGAEPGVS